MSALLRNRFAIASACVLAGLAACAGSTDDGPETAAPDGAPPLDEAGSDTGAEAAVEAGAVDVRVDAAPAALSPPLQACTAATPCPVEVPLPIPSQRNLVAISGSARDDVWAVGSSSTLLHFDGQAWAAPTSWIGDESGLNTLRSLWVARADDVWFFDGHDLVHANGWHGPSETRFERVSPPASYLRMEDLTGSPDGTVWVMARGDNGGANVAAHWSAWTDGGASIVARTRGILSGPTRLLTLTFADANTMWTAGEDGKLLRVWRTVPDGGVPNDRNWRFEEWNSHTNGVLFGVSAQGEEVWLVGEHGTVRRFGPDPDGARRFLTVDAKTAADLYAVRVFSPNDVWIVGERATILHFDGNAWWRVPTPFDGTADPPPLWAVWGADPGDLWFVGRGTALRLRRSEP